MSARRAFASICLLAVAAACASQPTGKHEPTLKDLESRVAAPSADESIAVDRAQIIDSYRQFLLSRGDDALRAEALRRLADLNLENIEARQAGDARAGAAPDQDYRAAVTHYRNLLRAYPRYPGNDGVLYQLARSHEQLGELRASLDVLNRLVSEYPHTRHLNEAQFRRGEIMFVLQDYNGAEHAYAAVLDRGGDTPFYRHALYKHGWSLFKQGIYNVALDSFFLLLDIALPGQGEDAQISRAERELIDDLLRVASLNLSYLETNDPIGDYFNAKGDRHYAHRVYTALGDFYLKSERIRDAAATYNHFVRRYPTHVRAPALQAQVIDAYRNGGFTGLMLAAKQEYVQLYDLDRPFWKFHDKAQHPHIVGALKTHIDELARHYHAQAQKSRRSEDYAQAAHWYRGYLKSFASDARAPRMNFLLADVLLEDKRYAEAAAEYEKTAYHYPTHERAAEAGYAAVLAYRQHRQHASRDEQPQAAQRAVTAGLKFADAYPRDARTPAVLTQIAEDLFAAKDVETAATVARRVLTLQPPADVALRRTAWTVVAHSEFERGLYGAAEKSYSELLTMLPANDARRPEIDEHLAASIYRQGEQLRSAGNTRAAVAAFQRVGALAPTAAIRATADYDAAAGLIALKDWPAAISILEGLRPRLAPAARGDVGDKLAVAYMETGQWNQAAREFEAMAQRRGGDPAVQREASWQAAALYEKGGNTDAAMKAYARYIAAFPRPAAPAIEARHRLAEHYRKKTQTKEHHYWLRETIKADRDAGDERNERTRFLAASAALILAEPAYDAYRHVQLKEPLKKTLKEKKARMQAALKAYDDAAGYGVAEVATAATYQVAEIYHDLSRALLASQRPKGLNRLELEQYDVLLEEQAFPFEEKAIEIHETNIKRVQDKIYDEWVKKSFSALGKLRPVRYAKLEKGEEYIDALH